MNKKQATILRANILGGMNAYVLDVIGDELGTEIWFQCGVPDGADEEMLMEIAEDEKEFGIGDGWKSIYSDVRNAKKNTHIATAGALEETYNLGGKYLNNVVSDVDVVFPSCSDACLTIS